MKRFPLLVLPLLGLIGCGDNVPVPDEFDAAFTSGRLCIPSQIANAAPSTQYPVRFIYNLYDCVKVQVSQTSPDIVGVFTCPGNGLPCQMWLLATAHLTKDAAVEQAKGCDARDLESPPSGRFTETTQDFNLGLPKFEGGPPLSGPFVVTIPYLTLEQGERVIERLKTEDAFTVLKEEVGEQNYPSRQITVNFSETATPVANADAIAAGDCHDIPLP